MSGDETKFYKYESSTSATVTIPLTIAKSLNWKHKDTINMVIKTIDIEGKNQIGLFLFKKE
jgi:hypothetical protein